MLSSYRIVSHLRTQRIRRQHMRHGPLGTQTRSPRNTHIRSMYSRTTHTHHATCTLAEHSTEHTQHTLSCDLAPHPCSLHRPLALHTGQYLIKIKNQVGMSGRRPLDCKNNVRTFVRFKTLLLKYDVCTFYSNKYYLL